MKDGGEMAESRDVGMALGALIASGDSQRVQNNPSACAWLRSILPLEQELRLINDHHNIFQLLPCKDYKSDVHPHAFKLMQHLHAGCRIGATPSLDAVHRLSPPHPGRTGLSE